MNLNIQASKINECHSLVVGNHKEALKKAMECGRYLSEVRLHFKTGSGRPPSGSDQTGFRGWVKKNCKFTVSPAYKYILLFEHWEKAKHEESLNSAIRKIRASMPKCKHYQKSYAKLIMGIVREEIRKWTKEDRKILFE